MYQLWGYAIPFFPNGLRMDYIIISLSGLGLLGVFGVVCWILDIQFIESLFKNWYLILIFFVFVLIWWLFSMTWDNKTFIEFLIGRIKFKRQKDSYEHELPVELMEVPIKYQNEFTINK